MPDEQERDETLMAKVVRGQSRALEPLVRRHADGLLTFIRRMVVDHHRGEELFQDVFLAVWTKRHLYEFPRPFKPWLYAIALNKCRAFFRSRGQRDLSLNGEAAAEPAAPDVSPPERVIADETDRQVLAAVHGLPPQQRAVVLLRVWDDLPYAAIAEVVGCNEGTVRSHMHHGLLALRRSLAPRLGVARRDNEDKVTT